MAYAYTPALDFNPKEADMTYEEILAILKDTQRTDYQRAADIHAALTKASKPSAFDVKPIVQRKKREARKPQPVTTTPTSNGLDHDEATA